MRHHHEATGLTPSFIFFIFHCIVPFLVKLNPEVATHQSLSLKLMRCGPQKLPSAQPGVKTTMIVKSLTISSK
jgi:hypothetical protein